MWYERVQRADREWISISRICRRERNWRENERNWSTRSDIHARNEADENDEFGFRDRRRRVIHDWEKSRRSFGRHHQRS